MISVKNSFSQFICIVGHFTIIIINLICIYFVVNVLRDGIPIAGIFEYLVNYINVWIRCTAPYSYHSVWPVEFQRSWKSYISDRQSSKLHHLVTELDFSLTHQGGRVITRLDILPSSPLHDRVRLKLVLRQCYLHMSGHVWYHIVYYLTAGFSREIIS